MEGTSTTNEDTKVLLREVTCGHERCDGWSDWDEGVGLFHLADQRSAERRERWHEVGRKRRRGRKGRFGSRARERAGTSSKGECCSPNSDSCKRHPLRGRSTLSVRQNDVSGQFAAHIATKSYMRYIRRATCTCGSACGCRCGVENGHRSTSTSKCELPEKGALLLVPYGCRVQPQHVSVHI